MASVPRTKPSITSTYFSLSSEFIGRVSWRWNSNAFLRRQPAVSQHTLELTHSTPPCRSEHQGERRLGRPHYKVRGAEPSNLPLRICSLWQRTMEWESRTMSSLLPPCTLGTPKKQR